MEPDNIFHHSVNPVTIAYKWFVREMNKVCEKLELKNTFMSNPHGLIKLGNISTAEEVALITS